MQDLATILSWIAAGVLLASGTVKLRAPSAATTALASLRIPLPGGGRALGAVEVAVALWVLGPGGRAANGVLALTYLALTVAAWRLRTTDAPCGCLGPSSARATTAHVVIDAVGATGAALAAAYGAPPVTALGADRASVAAATAVAAAVAAVVATLGARAEVRALLAPPPHDPGGPT